MKDNRKQRQETLFNFFNTKRTCLEQKDPFSDNTFFNQKEIKEEKRFSLQPENKKEEERYKWLIDIKDADGNPMGTDAYNKRTLYIPKEQWLKFTPFERQFWEIKSENYDRIVFFKKGKFYELYENDADIGASLFDLKITKRVNMRMAGFPVINFEQWAERFLSKGYSVVRVEQSENGLEKTIREKSSAIKENIIKREVNSILTSGTLIDGDLLLRTTQEYCMAVKFSEENKCGVCFVDASTASFFISFFSDDNQHTLLGTLLQQTKPKELLYEKGLSSTKKKLLSQINGCQLIPLCPLKEFPTATQTINEIERYDYFDEKSKSEKLFSFFSLDEIIGSSFGALLGYLRSLRMERKLIECGKFNFYSPLSNGQTLILDGQTLINLNILPSEDNPNSLLKLVDQCKTLFGKRILRNWVCHPLRNVEQIHERQETVKFFIQNNPLLKELKHLLEKIKDIERISSRAGMCVCKPKDFADLLCSLKTAHNLKLVLQKEKEDNDLFPKKLLDLLLIFPETEKKVSIFEKTIDVSLTKETGEIVLKHGVDKEYHKYTEEIEKNKKALEDYLIFIQKTVSSKTNYKSVGKEEFQLEIPENISVGKEFFLLSKRDGWKRYWTPELKKLVIKQQELVEMRQGALRSFFSRIQKNFYSYNSLWTTVSQTVGEIDCLCSLATLGQSFGEEKCFPSFKEEENVFKAENLYYPPGLVSNQISDSPFIPNDISFEDKKKIILLTGPNMGGKSTILRQTCLCIILAQIGSFIPATSCQMSIFDRIFTRIGANDNIFSGQSTFMVELSETARILKEATKHSFVVVDELGRGTSTFDGFAIAYGVLGYLANFIGCIGMFATHYKGLANDYKDHSAIFPMHMDCFVEFDTGKVVFLYKITPGTALKSYGMNVASIAGIPQEIIQEADEISSNFEEKEEEKKKKGDVCNTVTKIISLLHAESSLSKKELKYLFEIFFKINK